MSMSGASSSSTPTQLEREETDRYNFHVQSPSAPSTHKLRSHSCSLLGTRASGTVKDSGPWDGRGRGDKATELPSSNMNLQWDSHTVAGAHHKDPVTVSLSQQACLGEGRSHHRPGRVRAGLGGSDTAFSSGRWKTEHTLKPGDP